MRAYFLTPVPMSEKQYNLPFEGAPQFAEVTATVDSETMEVDEVLATITGDARDKAQQYLDQSMVPWGGE